VFGSLEFHDFDQFRQWIRGWDTDPFQLTTGPLRIRYDSIGSDDLTFARLRSNQRVSDSHAVEPGSIALVLALSPKRWCGIDVSPGSLVVMGPGREYRSLLEPGWESVEILVSQERLWRSGLPWSNARAEQLEPERCVFPVARATLERFHVAARRLSAPSPDGLQRPGFAWGDRIAELPGYVLSTLLPELLRAAPPATRSGGEAVRATEERRGFALAERAIRLADALPWERPVVANLASALRVSRRSLELAFRGALGCSPARYFRSRRLERARRGLVRGETVTEAALSQHFVSLGRFSHDYQRQFGELPSVTRATGRGDRRARAAST
jgi:AraC family ethanolamine operon transcriptional activator